MRQLHLRICYASAPKLLFIGPNFTVSINNFSKAGRKAAVEERDEHLAVIVMEVTGGQEETSKHGAKLQPTVLPLTDCYREGRFSDK